MKLGLMDILIGQKLMQTVKYDLLKILLKILSKIMLQQRSKLLKTVSQSIDVILSYCSFIAKAMHQK